MGNLISGKSGRSLIDQIRADRLIAGNNVQIVSQDEDGTFLRRNPSSSGSGGGSGFTVITYNNSDTPATVNAATDTLEWQLI
jgi:hypothetical protein